MTLEPWRVSLPRSLKKAINDLFDKNEGLRNLYDDKDYEFVKDAVREKIKFHQRPLQEPYMKEAAEIAVSG